MRSLARGPCMEGEGWDEVSDEGKGFLREMLQIDPKKRLSAEQALSHSWILTEDQQFNRRLSSITGLAAIASRMKGRAPNAAAPPKAPTANATAKQKDKEEEVEAAHHNDGTDDGDTSDGW